MRVQTSITFSLKNKPNDYVGLTSETWTIGKDGQVTLCDMVSGILYRVADFFALCYPADVLNADLDKLAEICKVVRFEPEGSQ